MLKLMLGVTKYVPFNSFFLSFFIFWINCTTLIFEIYFTIQSLVITVNEDDQYSLPDVML